MSFSSDCHTFLLSWTSLLKCLKFTYLYTTLLTQGQNQKIICIRNVLNKFFTEFEREQQHNNNLTIFCFVSPLQDSFLVMVFCSRLHSILSSAYNPKLALTFYLQESDWQRVWIHVAINLKLISQTYETTAVIPVFPYMIKKTLPLIFSFVRQTMCTLFLTVPATVCSIF